MNFLLGELGVRGGGGLCFFFFFLFFFFFSPPPSEPPMDMMAGMVVEESEPCDMKEMDDISEPNEQVENADILSGMS